MTSKFQHHVVAVVEANRAEIQNGERKKKGSTFDSLFFTHRRCSSIHPSKRREKKVWVEGNSSRNRPVKLDQRWVAETASGSSRDCGWKLM